MNDGQTMVFFCCREHHRAAAAAAGVVGRFAAQLWLARVQRRPGAADGPAQVRQGARLQSRPRPPPPSQGRLVLPPG